MSILDGLNLTPFEWSMSDVTSRSPMEFSVTLNCSGDFDSDLFSQAVAIAIKDQPMLQANASIGPTHRESRWRPAADVAPVIRWLTSDESLGNGFPDDFQPIDLEREIGFRLYGWRRSIEGEPRYELKFVFHHACCDGKGGVGFIGQVLVNYVCLLEGKPTVDSGLRDQILLRRSVPAPDNGSIVKRVWRKLVVRPRRAAQMLLSRPRLLTKSSEQSNELYSMPPRLLSVSLDAEATERFGRFATSQNTTTNVVLARELFHALNEESSGDSDESNRSFRVLIPFSLREELHERMPAANCVSMAYLEAKQNLLDLDSNENPVLLEDLTKQMAFIRRWNLHYSWIESIEEFAKYWPLLRLLRRSKKGGSKSPKPERPIASTVMTNFGRVFHEHNLMQDDIVKFGATEINTVHVALPCKSTINLNFAVNFYCDRLTLDVAYLPSVVSKERALRLLDLWRGRIEATAATG